MFVYYARWMSSSSFFLKPQSIFFCLPRLVNALLQIFIY
jgi:hypothetical protein